MHYRDAIVWQKARECARLVYGLMPKLPREEMFGMRSQLSRAVVSIPANIAEGWVRETQRDQGQFLAIAQGSLAETETLLILCEDMGWFASADMTEIRSLLDEVSRMLTALRRRRRS